MRQLFPLALAMMLLVVGCDAPDTELVDETHIAITNVNVLPMTQDTVLTDHMVIFRDGFITELAPTEDLEVREATRVIDGEGGYVMPGLAEMHTHLPAADDPEGIVDDVLTLFAAKGVTFARGMLGDSSHLALRDEVQERERFGPALRVASPFLSGSTLDTPGAAREAVRTYAEDGYDLLKIGEGLAPDVYDALVDEAQQQGLPYAGHVPDAVGLEATMGAGQQTVDHLDNFIEAMRGPDAPEAYDAILGVTDLVDELNRDRLPELVALTVETNTGIVPTMLVWERFFGETPPEAYADTLPELRYLPQAMVSGWEERLAEIRAQHTPEEGAAVRDLRHDILRALYEADAPILLGSDAPQMFNVPGFSIHREMQFMQDTIGMDPYDVLRSGTGAVRDFYAEDDGFGTVTVGERADLLLLENNPLEDVAHVEDIRGMALRGAWRTGESLEGLLREVEARWARD
jgi:imidazolonepropionase-like amidohydrolase